MKTSRPQTTVVPNKPVKTFRRRPLIALLLLVTVVATLAIPSGSAGKPKTVGLKTLDIELRRQNTPVWCWAATIAMVVQYLKNRNLEDCEVLSIYDRALGGRGLCCQGARECLRTGQTSEMGAILGRIFDVHGRYIPRALSFDEVVANIDADKPMIAGLQKGPSGHVVVIAGYDTSDNTIKVLDPMHGEHWVPYNVLIANWQLGIWNLSFEFTTDRDTGGSGLEETGYQR